MKEYLSREKILELIEHERAWLKEIDVYNLEKNLNRNIEHIIKTYPAEDCVSRAEYDKVVADLERVRKMLCTVEAMESLADEAEQLVADYGPKE